MERGHKRHFDSDGSGEAAVVQTLVASNFGDSESSAWAGLDDNDDFPLLTVHSRPWQAVNLARALTRVLLVNDGGGSDAEGTDLAIANEIRLDTNGLAPDTGSGGTSIPTCEFVSGELRAQTNYNGVMVKLAMMTGGPEAFAARSGCEVGFQNVTGEFAATLRLEISAPAIGDDLARSLTTDYALRITMDSDTAARDEFVRMIEAGGFDWFAASLTVAGGNPGDWDNDGNQNRYDWTPTSISVGGVLTQVDLLLGEERNRGTATNPWPIYNVWQLQAIDGIRVDAGVPTGDFNLFGSTVARLGSHYRLAVDIDATPTRDWQTIGFNPIGVEDNNITTNFIGAFDGEGREIRGLFMNSSDANAALFDHVGTGGRVSRVGLRDVDVRVRDGGNRAAGAVARLDGGTVSLVWASGTVQGALFNNAGLVGYLESGELRESWFVGDIEGNGGNGGLVGLMATGEIADSWAMAEVRQIGDNQPNGGLIGRANGGALTTSWSGGPVADGDNSGGIIGKPTTDDSVLAGGAIYLDTSTSGESKFEANNVAADIITVRTMATVRSGFDEAVWNYGAEAATDYPFLRGIESFRPGLQAALFADFQTQILPRIDEATLSVGGRTAMRQDESVNLILDTNGRAVGAPTPIPSCEAGATTAKTNYNNVTVRLRATDAGSVVFTDNCEIAFRFADSIGGATEFSAEVLIVSGEITILNWTHSFDLEAALDSSAMEAMTIFTAEIARDDFNWFSNALIVGSGSSIDWDNDGIANPYDWTPTSVAIGDGRSIGVNLTLEGAPDGSATMPWPIYNVWQLQAIDGVSVSDAGATVGGFTLFAATEAARLSMQYALALDIDATPTRGWGTVGFNPIGGSFSGFLDGGGYAVRGLFINLTVGDVGLFGIIDRGDGELAVRNMGVEDADIRGQSRIGILAGQVVDASFSRVWTTGKAFASNGAVGGLIGAYNKNSDNSGAVMMSWSSANVEAAADFAGGLIGLHRRTGGSSTALVFNDNWAAGDVTAARSLGGFSGSALIGSYARNWSSGVVSGASGMGGFSGTSIVGEHAYWNKDTSGIDDASTNSEGVVVQSLTEFDFGGDIESAAWDFGDNDISNGDADFPLLDNLSQPWQAVHLARALTRLLGVGEAAAITAATGVTLTTNGIRLDTNGLAADMGSRGTSTPTCAFVSASGVFRAQTNYNGVTVDLSLLAGGGEAFAEISAENTANCEIGFANATGEFAATLRVEISAPVIDGDPARGLTTDYALRIKPNIPAAARAAFVREIARDDFDWYSNALIVGGGSTLDWDNDGVLNPYDWTPTSVAIIDGGDLFEVNLTLGGANGSTRLPWPIYNIWQLQAIDGISISETGKRSDTFAFFGANAAAALTAQYRLELNIDASPTENWDATSGLSALGFDPIGGNFTGYMDGQGFAVRGLFIARGSDNIGLFSRISKTGEMAVWNMGVEDANIHGGDNTGALVGTNNANLGGIWTTGSVRGGNSVGGVAGQLTGQSSTVMMSWSTADVDGGEQVGGISGFNFPEDAAHRVFYNDNWAGGNVNSADAAAGGFVSNPYRSNFTRNWSAGAVLGRSDGGGFAGINTAPVSYASVYWNTDTSGQSAGGVDADGPDVVGAFVQTLAISNFGDSTAAAAWYFGDSDFSDSAADFPLLTAHDLPWQAVNLARALTRVLGVDGAKTVTAAAGMDFVADTIRLDTNAQAPNTRAGGTSAPSCDLDIVNGVLRAQTNYNGITINLSLLTDGNGSFASANGCDIDIGNPTGEFAATLRLEIFAPARGGDSARSLTTDYALRIVSAAAARAARAEFVARIEADGFDWFSPDLISSPDGTFTDWDGDRFINQYDYEPTSIDLGDGRVVGVNLTLDGSPDGSEANPFLIYNVWHLQAIDGVSWGHDGTRGGTGLFGFGDNTPLTAHYRVAVDIDATPSRGWSGGGFRPIGRLDIINDLSAAPAGDLFQGVLNGDGHQIRGLSVDMTNASAIQHVGIFSGIGASGKVVSLQLSDLFVRGGSGATGGLAGISEGLVSLVGGAGVVQGGSQPNVRVGGLVGWSRNSVVESWFVGEVKGDQSGSAVGQGIGGLIGRVMRGGDSITIRNNWAQARVEDTNPTGTGYVGGLIGHFSGVFQNGWSGGEVVGPGSSSRGLIGILVNASSSGGGGFLDRSTSGSTRPFIASAVSARGVATMLTVSSGLSNAWNYGGATDYPFLSRIRNDAAGRAGARLRRCANANFIHRRR